MGILYREKTFHAGKNDFAPSEKYACYAPAWLTGVRPAVHLHF